MSQEEFDFHHKTPSDVDWNFPPTGGGIQEGVNHPGVAHFTGNRLHHLAREIIQNSLDAKLSDNEPVSIEFEIKELNKKQVPSVGKLIEHIDACINECNAKNQAEYAKQMESAKSVFTKNEVTFLKIHDRETTGLKDDHWRALVKASGTSVKTTDGAGGSHGIGKNAAFVVTDARTVFYWTAFKQSREETALTEKFQGKSILMCHEFDGEECQGTGFWGKIDNCKEIDSLDALPSVFRILDKNQKPVQGTALWIAGFNRVEGWQNEIASHVIENFFYAIEKGGLKVVLEPEDDELLEIDASTIDQWLERLESTGNGSSIMVKHTRIYLDFIRNPESSLVKHDQDLGQYRIWVKLEEGYPNSIGLIRNTGMLITTNQKEITRFQNVNDFIALCYFEDPNGNNMLRKMENPQHNQFSPDHLPPDERSEGEKILKRVTKEIRQEVRNFAKRTKEITSEELYELSRYLPLNRSEGPLDTGKNQEKAFGKYGDISKKKISIPTYPLPAIEPEDSDDTDGNGNNGGDSTNGNGTGTGGTGSNDGKNKMWKNVVLEDIRVIPHSTVRGVYRVSFTPIKSTSIRLQFEIGGDGTNESRNAIEAVQSIDSNKPLLVPLTSYEVTENTRFSIDVFDDTSVPDTAWILKAQELKAEEPT